MSTEAVDGCTMEVFVQLSRVSQPSAKTETYPRCMDGNKYAWSGVGEGASGKWREHMALRVEFSG